ncbi:MAG: hypothetical protein GXO49_01345 [Chlorobi bacterium]|nr:hypothetical protein [Chlorobiota bacterium]
MALLRQYFNGTRVHSLSVNATGDDLSALVGLMDGKVEQWETKSTGGTATAMPETFNTQRWVSRSGKQSCSFRIHHINPEKDENDVEGLIVGKFEVGFYDGAPKADEAYPVYDNLNR